MLGIIGFKQNYKGLKKSARSSEMTNSLATGEREISRVLIVFLSDLIMSKCDNCGRNTDGLPFKCRRCHNEHCHKCHLPEDHYCPGLGSNNVFHSLKSHRSNSITFSSRKFKKYVYHAKWFVIWTLIHAFLLWIFGVLLVTFLGEYQFYQNDIWYYLIIGLLFSLSTYLISCAIRHKRFRIGMHTAIWTIIYVIILWGVEFLIGLAGTNPSSAFLFDGELEFYLWMGAGISLIAGFLKRAKVGRARRPRYHSDLPWGTIFWWGIVIIAILWGYFYDFGNPLDYVEGDKFRVHSNQYSFPYFYTTPISYSFDSTLPCEGNKRDRVIQAFNIIQDKTDGIVSFDWLSSGGEITIRCHPYPNPAGHAGYGGPTVYEDGEIIGGDIDLYPVLPGYSECYSYPVTEIHEILHVFGFDHFSNSNSIMYGGGGEFILDYGESDQPYVCMKIDDVIVDCLKNIYSNGENGSSCEGLPQIDLF